MSVPVRRPPLVVALGMLIAMVSSACSPSERLDAAPNPASASSPATEGKVGPSPVAGASSADRPPSLRVRTVARDLERPWDVQQASGGQLLVSERNRALISVVRKGERWVLADLSPMVWTSIETGLMSLAVDHHRRVVWACHGAPTADGGHDVRVTLMNVNRAWTAVTATRTLISGFPTSTGRHGGCRLMLDRSSAALVIGTGDAAVGTNPRDLDSLGGKVLRVNRHTGAPMRDNPYADSASDRRFVWTYGHRNVQGVAQRADGSLWSVEHGPTQDDEVNLLTRGGDYGWHPIPGYNESVPMTDHSLAGKQQDAAWSSGDSTLATSGAAWVRGRQWGSLNGTLAVAALEDSLMLFIRFDRKGRLVSVVRPSALQQFGRLRSVTSARNGDLLVTTDNVEDDRILRISPR
jgi:glucose/arabinose dehydrogenase